MTECYDIIVMQGARKFLRLDLYAQDLPIYKSVGLSMNRA